MEKIKSLCAHRIFKIFKWAFLILLGLYIVLVIGRAIYLFNKTKSDAQTNVQVEKIHNTKLTLDDVMGKNLPPDPGVQADKTVPGFDVNNNGIRDDVERAIFKEYPNSAKTRAVLLQYALALQMEFIQPIINKDTVIATIQEEDRAYSCVGKILTRNDNNKEVMYKYFSDWDKLILFVENQQFNTPERKKAKEGFLNKIGSYNSLSRTCDIDYLKLSN